MDAAEDFISGKGIEVTPAVYILIGTFLTFLWPCLHFGTIPVWALVPPLYPKPLLSRGVNA